MEAVRRRGVCMFGGWLVVPAVKDKYLLRGCSLKQRKLEIKGVFTEAKEARNRVPATMTVIYHSNTSENMYTVQCLLKSQLS